MGTRSPRAKLSPITNRSWLKTSRAVGFEVLARWEHPARGVLLPDVFVPIAEDTGTIGEMTLHLLERAMSDAKQWPAHVFVSINVSPRQISDAGLASRILGLLAKASFFPHRLMVEIAENAVAQRLDNPRSWFDRFEMSESVLRLTILAPAIRASTICASSNSRDQDRSLLRDENAR